MNALKRLSMATLIAAGITAGTAGIAAATTEYVGGGTWQYGVTGIPGVGTSYSNYFHGSRCHGSTAVGTYTVRDSASAGSWARAEAPRAVGNNQAYWRNNC